MSSHRVLCAVASVCLLWIVSSVSTPALAECDIAPPQLAGFDFNPSAINVTSGAAGVTCDMTFTDTLSGVSEATCNFRAPGFTQFHSCTAVAPSIGDRNAGTFSCTVDIPQYSEAGTWRASTQAIDLAGNSVQISDFELEFVFMLPVNLAVTSTSDLQPPALIDFDFNPKTPDVSGGPVDVTCSAALTDALAGVDRMACFFQGPVEGIGQVCFAFAPVSGDRNNGTFSCDVTIPQYSRDGIWTASVLAWDEVENLAAFDAPALQGLGFPTDLTVTSNPVDVLTPVVTDFDFNPKSVDSESSSAIVNCSVDVTDDLSGVQFVGCQFESPSLLQSQGCFAQTPTSGTPTNGTYVCSVVIPRYSEGGIWKASLEILDNVANLLEADALALAAAGFPTDLDVMCGGTPAGFTIRFSSRTTIVWDPVTDAFLYNIYRGEISGLVDLIPDGAPDGGYGTCQNANDPNPTDTIYVDAEDPLPGAGFHYLASYRTISGEAGLGTRSDGVPRTVMTPCP